ncbi:MAG: substrate-binding domain-containing protein [Syntrophales bacterium LBB04]|nr:substrate-binding domain-containing protein [Syntrophales bacterium LBB04]
MRYNITGNILHKTVLVMAIGFVLACSVSLLAAPAKPVKQSPAPQAAKTDPNEWKKVLEAAKKEGKIVMCGPPGEQARKSLVDMFQQEYPEITVEFTVGAGRNFWPRVRQERELGNKLWDFRVGGMDAQNIEAKGDGYLAPIRPLLLPEIADDSKWIGGADGLFYDREKKYILGYMLYIVPSAYVNRDFIKESDLKSTEQLLAPKFRGKFVLLTPTGGATRKSLGHMAFMYGENFIRDLLSKQDVIVTDDTRQLVEWLVRGKYPIATGFDLPVLIPFQKQGLGLNVVALDDKIDRVTAGSGIIHLFEGAPHPNAARVYINWLLSQKTQLMLTKNLQLNSRRIDVPPIDTPIDPAKISRYRNADTEEIQAFNLRYDPVIQESLKK